MPKPTIAELEEILDGKEVDIEILPNGEIKEKRLKVPRQKKSDSEIITNILEDGNLTTADLQWIVNIASRKLKNRQPRQGDNDVHRPVEQVRQEKQPNEEKE